MSRSDRLKLQIAVPVIALCMIWIAYLAIRGINWSGPVKPPDTPAHRTADEVTQKLLDRVEFADASLVVESNDPVKFKVVGAVRAAGDVEKLKAYIESLQPGIDLEMDVVVLPH